MIEIRKANMFDALAINVREADCLEVWRSNMLDANRAVEHAIAASTVAFTGFLDGQILCIFGVATTSLITKTGSPWLLGSDLITQAPFEFLASSKEHIDKLKDGYVRLENYVDVDNTISIRWLKFLGFTVEKEAVPFGVAGKPFRRFKMECNHV